MRVFISFSKRFVHSIFCSTVLFSSFSFFVPSNEEDRNRICTALYHLIQVHFSFSSSFVPSVDFPFGFSCFSFALEQESIIRFFFTNVTKSIYVCLFLYSAFNCFGFSRSMPTIQTQTSSDDHGTKTRVCFINFIDTSSFLFEFLSNVLVYVSNNR